MKRIIFSGESSFSLQTTANRQNCSISESQRSYTAQESPERFQNLMVRRAISKSEVIVSCYSDDYSVTRNRYKISLRYHVFPKLANYPSDKIIQQDRAPPHHAILVRLEPNVSNRWTRRGGRIHWPASSPELTHVISLSVVI